MGSVGIDYSRGMANVDKKTGIHYGVINNNEVLQAWADSSEAYYGEPEESEDGEDGAMDMEPLSWLVDSEGYVAEQRQDDCDIFVTKSPYYTTAAYCSPCAPGAGYMTQTVEDGIKTYCFGHHWFESGVAPYPVYSVKTGELVKA
jgi:hypothetical protein